MTGRTIQSRRGGFMVLALGMVLALLATITITSTAEARNGREYQARRGERVRINDNGTFQIDHTGSGRGFGIAQVSEDVVRLRSGELRSSTAGGDSVTIDRARAHRSESNVFVVQFETYPLESYLEEIEILGGIVQSYVPENSYLVEMPRTVNRQVGNLQYVKETYPYNAKNKIDPTLDATVAAGLMGTTSYELALFETGSEQVNEVTAALEAVGAQPDLLSAESGRVVVELTADQVDLALSLDQVEFVDTWAESEPDVVNTRAVSGADYLQNLQGYTGQGIRGASWDSGLDTTHVEFQSNPPIVHSNSSGSANQSHGTGAWGVIFADGLRSGYRGVLPDGEGIAATATSSASGYQSKPDFYRYANANGAVFVTSSYGKPRTQQYTSDSQAIDQALFETDIVALQSQSNAGRDESNYSNKRNSRPEAWAKNVLAVGGISHYNNANIGDDEWNNTGSIGPAADGRIKPDLSFYFDGINSTNSGGRYDSFGSNGTGTYGGTSAATPTTAGYIGIFFEMWADGVFRPNAAGVNNPTTGLNRNAYNVRPKAATMRALAINTAYDYAFSGTGQSVANTRAHQGWGRIDAQEAYQRSISGNMPLIVDETAVVTQGGSAQSYSVSTTGGNNCEFRATMVYTDPAGSPAASKALVNDLSLRVTAPNGTQYWGNNGLWSGNWSTSGGSANDVDTVENVFVNNAPAGNWTIEVIPTQINQDARLETSAIDADFGLVVSGSCMGSAVPTPQLPAGTGAGSITYDVFSNIDGTSVANLTAAAAFPASPSSSTTRSSFEAPSNTDNSYGARAHGFIHPPLTGEYTFWIASDDNGELRVNGQTVATVPGWTGSQNWTKYPEQRSATVVLQAGETYSIEALMKEGSGGDNLAVAWQPPGMTGPSVIPGEYLSPGASTPPLPATATPVPATPVPATPVPATSTPIPPTSTPVPPASGVLFTEDGEYECTGSTSNSWVTWTSPTISTGGSAVNVSTTVSGTTTMESSGSNVDMAQLQYRTSSNGTWTLVDEVIGNPTGNTGTLSGAGLANNGSVQFRLRSDVSYATNEQYCFSGLSVTGITAPAPTSTPIPATAVPTSTPIPATAVPTSTPIPATAVPTSTPIPPTATAVPSSPSLILGGDFESGSSGWVANPNGSDTGTTGQWSASNPGQTSYQSSVFQPDTSSQGSIGLFTDGRPGSGVGSYDIDNGVVSIKSPTFRVPASGTATISFDWFLAHYSNATNADFMRVSIVGSTTQTLVNQRGTGSIRNVNWNTYNGVIGSNFAGQQVYLLIEAADADSGSLIEAGFDDLVISGVSD